MRVRVEGRIHACSYFRRRVAHAREKGRGWRRGELGLLRFIFVIRIGHLICLRNLVGNTKTKIFIYVSDQKLLVVEMA